MKKALFHTKDAGFTLVEILLASTLFVLVVTTFIGIYQYGRETITLNGTRDRAVLIANEGAEAVRNIRDEDFALLTTGTHGLTISGNEWILSGSNDVTDIFTREVVITDIDAETKQIVVNVTWQQNSQRSGSTSVTEYLTNWREAAPVVNDWSNPTSESTFNLSPGNQDGINVISAGNYLYTIKQLGSPNFTIFDVSNTANPIVISNLNLAGSPTDIALNGSYIYISSTSNTEELIIIDVSNPNAPVQVGSYNAPGAFDALSVAVSGNTAFIGRVASTQNEFYSINVSNPATPSLLHSLNTTTISNIFLMGNYAYAVSDSDTSELQIFRISIPASLVFESSFNISGSNNGRSVVGFGTTLLVGLDGNAGLRILNISNIYAVSQISAWGTDTINNLDLNNDNSLAFLAVTDDSAEIKIVDITTLGSPALRGNFNIVGNEDMNGIDYNGSFDRAFGVGTHNTEGLVILKP